MKSAILVHSDPKGGEEALGRVFNAMAVAHDLKEKGEDVRLMFLGAGTRWVAELNKEDNPVHRLYELVKDTVEGASCGCADVFGARDDVEKYGVNLLTDNAIPGTSGLPSVASLMSEGYQILNY